MIDEPTSVTLCADCPDEEEAPKREILTPEKHFTISQENYSLPLQNDSIPLANDAPPTEYNDKPPGVGALYKVEATVHKYTGDWTAEQIAAGEADDALYEITHDAGNLLTTVGAGRLLARLIGAAGQAMDNTHTFLGVGNTSTAAAIGNTDLAAATGSTNRQWKGMDATYPSIVTNAVTLKATYTSAEGNFTAGWLEWGIEVDDGTSSPGTAALSTGTQKLFNRKVPAGGLGVKSGGTTWTLTVVITAT